MPAARRKDNTAVSGYSLKLGPNFATSGFISHLSVDSDELPWVALGPRWQDDVTQLGAILLGTWDTERKNINILALSNPGFCPRLIILTQVEVVGVEQELRQVEELGDELLDVGHVVFGGREPGFTHTVEHPVSQVKMTSLVVTQHTGRWFDIGSRHINSLSPGILC